MTAAAADTRRPAPVEARKPLLRSGRVRDLAAHAYVWTILLIFVLPVRALFGYSLTGPGENAGLNNYGYVFSTFGDNLLWSLKISGLTLFLNVLISLPAGYAIVRKSFPGKRLLFSVLTLPLYVPGAVIGISLVLTYNFTYHLTSSMWGLVLAMSLGTFPLMLTPLVVALKDLPIVFEEAAACLGATKWQTYRRIVLPLIGPGLSAGLLLCFIIVFNEYLVTPFLH